jgi:hypothetical protein
MTECVLCGREFDPSARPCGVRSDLCSDECQGKAELERQVAARSERIAGTRADLRKRKCACGRETSSRKEPPVCSQCQYHTAKTDRRRGETGTASAERIEELAARAKDKLPTVFLFNEPWRGI